ncbi:MAG: hypothetical protein LBT16_03945 [Treponema sp.]|nr:hypothetical protein [Treponema sp.]
MHKKMYAPVILLLLCFFGACNFESLSSNNYWSGNARETAWVEQHLKMPAKDSASAFQETAPEETVPLPHRTPQDGKFRIAVVISGDYWEYYDNFKGLIEGFSNIGWADPVVVPQLVTSFNSLILWLSKTEYSDYVEFPPELFFSLDWGDNNRAVENSLIRRIPDADAIIAYGTAAAKMFYQQDSFALPVVADAVSDIVAAGVTLTETDSGKDFFSGKLDPEAFKRQIRLFHEITGFKKLGIAYSDDEYGRVYGAVRDVEAVAAERGFEIVRNTNMTEELNEKTVPLYLDAIRNVASRSDAVYIGAPNALTEYDIIRDIVGILDEARVPSFAQEGSIRVKDGILFSLASSGMIRSGTYTATKMAHIFGGESPRAQNQIFESIPDVAVNLTTAEKIGFPVPVDIIVNSDEIYLSRDGSAPVNVSSGSELDSSFTNFAKITNLTNDTHLPRIRGDGSPFKIAVFQSGLYWEFNEHFRGIVQGLISSGWARNMTIPSGLSVSEIVERTKGFSDYVEFPPEYVFDLEWGQNNNAVRAFFSGKRPDVDLIIAFGSVAGKLFDSYANYPIPVLMEGITDPIGGKYVSSVEDSGKDFLTCRIDPKQYQRQIQLFHDFTGFKRLGIVYGDDDYGRSYGAVNDVEMMAQRRGFTIVRNTNVKERIAPDTPVLYLRALRDVASRSDAVYLGASTALTEYDIADQVAAILLAAKMPSFALEGDIRVRQGIMLGISSIETEKFGIYNADKIAAIFSGVPPRSLPQMLEGMPSIILNLDTAKKIGFSVPLSILSSIDQFVYPEK